MRRPDAGDDREDPLTTARGILIGLALSLPLWGLIGGLLYVCARLWGR